MGQTSPPPRVTEAKLAEEHNISAAVTTLESLMVSHEKENGLSSLPVSVGVLDHPPHDNPENQILDPGFKREGILQTIVDLSNMLLQIPLNAADLSESDCEMVNVTIKDLKKLQEEYKKSTFDQNASASKTSKSTTMTQEIKLQFGNQKAQLQINQLRKEKATMRLAMDPTEPKGEKNAFLSAKEEETKGVNRKTSDRLDRIEEMLTLLLGQKLSQGSIKTQNCLSHPTNNTIGSSNHSNQPISFKMSNVGSGPEII